MKPDELIRIPVSPEAHQRLKELSRAAGYKSLSHFLRDTIQRQLGDQVDMQAGLKSWGGDRTKDPE